MKEEEGEGVKGKRRVVIHKSAEVACIARIPVNNIILGKSANDVRATYVLMYMYKSCSHVHVWLMLCYIRSTCKCM